MKMEAQIRVIPIEQIIPNRFQPRLTFDETALTELSSSVREHGIVQPLVVRRVGEKFEVIAGERRLKAAQMAGLVQVPVIIADMDDNESAEVAIVENTQRRNLSAIEEAKSYQKLLDRKYLTQEQLAKRMGTSQSNIANKLRLLNLDGAVQDALMKDRISERHARSLLRVTDKMKQVELLNKIIQEKWPVVRLDQEIDKVLGQYSQKQEVTAGINVNSRVDIDVNALEENAQDIDFGPVKQTDIPVYEYRSKVKDDKKKNIGLFGNTLESESVNMDSSLSFGFNPFQTSSAITGGIGDDYDLLELDEDDDVVEETKETTTKEVTPAGVKQVYIETSDDAIQAIKDIIMKAKENNVNLIAEEFNFEEVYQFVIRLPKEKKEEENKNTGEVNITGGV